ncbi:MAG: BrnT family toxin [Deltaproteobacteria bacterium]|nr:BrnT family toxin [Deltaproteobacteria bacterium]
MNIVWEPKKAKTNFLKHQIRFSDAELVLFDPLALSREDEDTDGERRFVSM